MHKFHQRQALIYIYWFFGIALLIPVWMGSHFPTEDGLAHMYWADVYRELGNAGTPWQAFYERNALWIMPNLSYFALQYALSAIVEPHMAQKIIISLLLLGWVAAIHFLSVSISRELTIGALASLLLIHSSWLYGGYLNFLIGVPILLISLALHARIFGLSRMSSLTLPYVLLALLGIVGYYSHFVVAGLFLILVLLSIIFSLFSRQRFPSHALFLAIATLPTCLLTLIYLLGSSFGPGRIRWEPLQKSVTRFVGLAFFRGFATGDLAFWLALALLGVIFASLCFSAVCAFRNEQVPLAGRFILLVAASLALLYFISPEGVGQGHNIKARLQLVMWAWLLPSLPYSMSDRARAAVLAGVSLLLCWQITDFSLRIRRFNQDYMAVLEQAEALPPGTTLKSMLRYENAGFEGSFIRVLAHSPEDVAYHCRCVLVSGYHPSTAFYWIRSRPEVREAPDYLLDLEQLPGSRLSLVTSRNHNSDAPPQLQRGQDP